MKLATVLAALAVGVSAQFAAPDLDKGKTREEIGHIVVPGGKAPEVQQLKPRFNSYHSGSKRTKVRYGSFRLPSTKDRTIMSTISGEPGTTTSITPKMKKPCDTCNLLVAQAGLEFANGTEATTAQGAWLHHIVVVANGPGRTDTTCAGVSPGERFFSSGNERTVTAFGDVLKNTVKSAFPITPSDTISMQWELMNMNTVPKDVYIVVDYEYFPGPRPDDWKIAKAMWLDVTDCGISSTGVPRGSTSFVKKMHPWTSTFDGQMLGTGGHLHDGGTNLLVKLQKKSESYQKTHVLCDSIAEYTAASGAGSADHGAHKNTATSWLPKGAKGGSFKGARSAMMDVVKRDGPVAADGKSHIAEMSTCSNLGMINRGDKLWIEANYDFNKHAGMKSNNRYAAVMGIAIMYAAAEPKSLS